jgi:hypothetical protein
MLLTLKCILSDEELPTTAAQELLYHPIELPVNKQISTKSVLSLTTTGYGPILLFISPSPFLNMLKSCSLSTSRHDHSPGSINTNLGLG